MPYYLRTFGGLGLLRDGTPVASTESRRKPLALLVLLAGHLDRGLTREKIAAFLWPESDEEKARGVLKQTLYVLRQELEEKDLFLGSSDLRLNPEVIQADVWSFDDHCARRQPLEAVQVYRGPFLDGFHLAESADFSRWVDDQRDRYRRRFANQIEILALGAMGQNAPRDAADWWLRLTEQDPYNVRAVSGLLHACLQAGDRPSAIRYAERHMSLLRKELEITPDPEIRRLVEQARARPADR